MTFGKRLKQLRLEKGLSQGQLADKAGLRRLSLAKLEQGVIAEPKWSTVKALSVALGVPCQEFMTTAPK